MTTFEPIIGSGFDAVAGQRQFWQGFNRQTEEANIARLNARENLENNWLANVANMRSAAQDRDYRAQLAMDEASRRDALWRDQQKQQAALIKEEQRWRTAENTSRLAEEHRRTLAMENQQKEKNNLWLAQQQEAISQQGASFSQELAAALAEDRQAQSDFDQLSTRQTDLKNELVVLSSKPELEEEEKTRKMAVQTELNSMEKAVIAASKRADRAERNRESVLGRIGGKDFFPDLQAGTITHRPTGRVFNFRAAINAAAQRPASPAPLPGLGGGPWPGMTAAAGPAAAPTAPNVPMPSPGTSTPAGTGRPLEVQTNEEAQALLAEANKAIEALYKKTGPGQAFDSGRAKIMGRLRAAGVQLQENP